MTVRFSTGVRNALAGGRGFGALFNLGSLLVFSGTQPLTADSAVVGTHLGTATAASGALTQETPASGSITITGSGTSVLTLTVGTFNIIPGIVVPWNGTTTQTAADLCDAINRVGMFSATVSGAVVTFKPPPGAGDAYNAAVVAHTGTVTATYVNMSGGVTPVNGLVWTPPSLGVVSYALGKIGIDWNHLLNGTHAMILVVMASVWKQISYNFLFFLAGLQSIPKSVIEAAVIDGARPMRRFWTIIFPLLSPTIFFLVIVNVVYAFFDTFGIIDTMTRGGPAKATETLVYKVYQDGLLGSNLGSSAAQSVILMAIVIALTAIQFRFVERKVNY